MITSFGELRDILTAAHVTMCRNHSSASLACFRLVCKALRANPSLTAGLPQWEIDSFQRTVDELRAYFGL